MNVIYRMQFGFRKSHSTSHAISDSVEKILTEVEKRDMLLEYSSTSVKHLIQLIIKSY